MRGIGSVLALLLLCGPAGASAPAEQAYRIANYGRLATDVYVNGQGPFNFLIDTASSRSLIFERVRKKLGLTQSQPERLLVYGINDVAEAMPVKPDRLTVAGEEITGLTVGVLPETSSADPDGILGVDVLSRYFVVLDRGTMRLTLLPPGEQSAQPYRGWAQARLTPRPLKKFPIRFWYLSTRFNDHALSTLFDLGAGTTMMNWQAAERLGVHKRDFSRFGPPPAELQDVLGKRSPALRIENMEVRLPGKSWDKQLVIVADAPVFNYFDLEDQAAAIVGPGLLRDTSLAIDFAGQRLFVGPTIDGRYPPKATGSPVEDYRPHPKDDAIGRAPSEHGSCALRVFAC
jgi:predicted aspartyl protease